MTKTKKRVLSVICILVVAFVGLTVALFLGYFDHGQYDLLEAKWSDGRVAMVASRIDVDEALGGLETYVLIGDHIYSPHELRSAKYRLKAVFSALSNCLHVSWKDSHTLVISPCEGSIEANYLNSEKHRVGDVAVIYENIAEMPQQ